MEISGLINVTTVMQGAQTLLVALCLFHFYYSYRKRYLLLWAWSWLCYSVYFFGGLVAFLLAGYFTSAHPYRLTTSMIYLAAGYLQVPLLLFGAYELAAGKITRTKTILPWLIAAVVFAGALVVATSFISNPFYRFFLRVGLHSLISGSAFLLGAYCIYRIWSRGRKPGKRIALSGFIVYGAYQFLYTALTFTPGNNNTSYLLLCYVLTETVLLFWTALGLVVWLLEDERHQATGAQHALRDSERKFRKVLENSLDVIYQFNLETKNFDYMSPAAAELSGYTPEEFIDGGFPFSNSLVHPEDLNSIQKSVSEALSSTSEKNAEHTIEYRLKTKHRGYRWISENRAVVRNSENRPTAIIATARDVTDRKQSEETLRLQKTLLEAQSEASLDGILVVGRDGDILLYNRRFLEIWEIPEELLKTKSNREAIETVLSKLANPKNYLETFSYFNENFSLKEQIEIPLKDGRIIERYTAPVIGADDTYYGRIWYFRDITDRHRSEEALEQSERDYRTIFEQAHDAILIFSPEGEIILDANERACELYGFSRSQFIGMSLENISKDPIKGREKVKETLKADECLNFETVQFRSDGSEMLLEVNGSKIVYQGQLAILSINRDITERKRTERALRESREHLELAQQVALVGSFEWNLALSAGVASKELQALYGEVSGFQGRYEEWTKYVHPEDLPLCEQELKSAIETGELVTEFRIIRPDGNIRWLHAKCRIFYDEHGVPERLVGVNMDITERKQSEFALAEANQRAIREYDLLLQKLTELAQTAGSARDLKTVYRAILEFTRTTVPCTGFFIALYNAEKQLRTATYAWDGGVEIDVSSLPPMAMSNSPNSRAAATGDVIIEDDFQTAMTGQPVFNVGLETDPNLPQSCIVVPMAFMGRIVGTIEVQSTEWAAYTKEHATTMQMAANLVANAIENVRLLEQERMRDEQLRQAQKLESVGRLAGGIAHDFNNMLTAINGYSDLILRKLESDNPLRPQIVEIKKAGERSAALTNQLLAFSRQQMLQPKLLDLNENISDTAKMLQRLIGEHIRLNISLSPDLNLIQADPGQLAQVIMNLAVNARDAMPDGGTLTLETANINLDREYAARHISAEPGSYVTLSVTDTGAGMDKETLQQIFDPFFTTKEIGKGTGLGLATVYGIVKQSGGYIWVYSEVGYGTTFKIYLPCVSSKNETDEALDSQADCPPGTETLMLVEDEDMVREMTREILESNGYQVIVARNGIEALEKWREFSGQIDLLMTDVVMPEMGGRQLAEKLYENDPRLPVLFTSGYTDDAVMLHGIVNAGANFIQKPYSPDSLLHKVREILRAVEK